MYQGGNTAEQERQQRLRLRNERLDFENWAQPNGFDIERGEYGSYIYTPTYQVWQAWQARADMPERMGADRWADTLERLPPAYQAVLLLAGGIVNLGYWREDVRQWQTTEGGLYPPHLVHYWQPLPAAPEQP